jgi:hypothetical protein
MLQGSFDQSRGRIQPLMMPRAYKTYSISAPMRTHWRSASCEEYECDDFLKGFITTVDMTTDLGQKQFHYLSHDRTRTYRMEQLNIYVVQFIYGPGNRCFRSDEHRIPTGRPARYLVVGGDWRGNPERSGRIHRCAEDWVDDNANHLIKLQDVIKRG